MRRCWLYNVLDRPSFSEILQNLDTLRVSELSYIENEAAA